MVGGTSGHPAPWLYVVPQHELLGMRFRNSCWSTQLGTEYFHATYGWKARAARPMVIVTWGPLYSFTQTALLACFHGATSRSKDCVASKNSVQNGHCRTACQHALLARTGLYTPGRKGRASNKTALLLRFEVTSDLQGDHAWRVPAL